MAFLAGLDDCDSLALKSQQWWDERRVKVFGVSAGGLVSTFLLKPFISSHDFYALRLYVLISLHLIYKMNKMGLEGHLEYMHLLTIAATHFHVSGHFKTTVDFHLVASLFCRMRATGCRFTGWSMVMGESSTWMMCFAMWLMTKTGWVDMKSLKLSFFSVFQSTGSAHWPDR